MIKTGLPIDSILESEKFFNTKHFVLLCHWVVRFCHVYISILYDSVCFLTNTFMSLAFRIQSWHMSVIIPFSPDVIVKVLPISLINASLYIIVLLNSVKEQSGKIRTRSFGPCCVIAVCGMTKIPVRTT